MVPFYRTSHRMAMIGSRPVCLGRLSSRSRSLASIRWSFSISTSRRFSRKEPKQLVVRLISVGPDEHAGGVRMLRKFSDQDLSLTDAVGLHLMKARRIAKCWSADFHLRLTGVSLVVDER